MQRKKSLKTTLALTIFISILLMTVLYLKHMRHWVAASHAFVNGNIVPVSAEVSGKILKSYVANNTKVKKGDLLFKLDPATFNLALDEATQNLTEARRYEQEQQTILNEAIALVQQRQAEVEKAKVIAIQSQDQNANIRVITSEAVLKAAKDKLNQIKLATLSGKTSNERVAQAMDKFNKAKLALNQTKIVASASGSVANSSLHLGQRVHANQVLLNLVPTENVWIEAHFVENELHKIRKGQPATIHFTSYPNQTFHGKVESIAAITGKEKEAKHVAVHIALTDHSPLFPLRIGSTAKVEINVKDKK
ncbi:MAG: HlyD family secretion protein [Candidatus Berkiellales bacterium]